MQTQRKLCYLLKSISTILLYFPVRILWAVFQNWSGLRGKKQVQQCFPPLSEGLQCCLGEWTRMKCLEKEKISTIDHRKKPGEAKISIFRVGLGDDVSNVQKLNFLTLNRWKGWNTNMKRSQYRRLQQWFTFCGGSSSSPSSSASSFRFILI